MKEPIIQIFSWQLICNLINEQRKKGRNLNLHILIFITVNSCVSYALFSTISSKHSGCKVTNEQRFTLILTVDFCITEEWNRHLISSMNGIDIHLYNCSFLIINKHTSSLNTNMHESEFYSLFLLWKKKQLFASVSRLRNLSIVYVLIWTVSWEAWLYLVSYFTV